ncbi:MAG: nucleoside triphosphate pyrophosphatase [Burkholderiales bacterium]
MNAAADNRIYLASRSPRRRELLGQIGVPHQLIEADVDESPLPGEAPRDYVLRLARDKALAGWRALDGRQPAPVLAADTTVALGGRMYGKPLDRADAGRMLAELSGSRHQVFTAIALRLDARVETALSVSEVEFCVLGADAIREYIASGEADDKAGAYGIQGLAAKFVVEIRGSYSGIMGLPLYETAQLLQRLHG